jgi:hypothetical protein
MYAAATPLPYRKLAAHGVSIISNRWLSSSSSSSFDGVCEMQHYAAAATAG